jgi:hypothetical protein
MPEVIDAMTTIESVGTDFTPETTDPQNELGEAITNLWSAHLRLPGWVLSYRLIVQFSAQIGSTGAILRCIGYGYGASRDVFPLYRQINFVREFLSLCLIRNTNNASLGRPRVLGSEVYQYGRCCWSIPASVARGINHHRNRVIRPSRVEESKSYAARWIVQV